MARLIIAISIVLIAGFSYIGYNLHKTIKENTEERLYGGYVKKLYITEAGYKISSERHVVFYCDSIKRNIDVRISNNLYVNLKVSDYVCFSLNKLQLNE